VFEIQPLVLTNMADILYPCIASLYIRHSSQAEFVIMKRHGVMQITVYHYYYFRVISNTAGYISLGMQFSMDVM